MASKEVRYEYLKGRDAVKRLCERPVAFLPLGSLERHGDHLPMGLDVMKAHAVCCAAARKIGGVVFPAHFYSAIHISHDPKKRAKMKEQRKIIQWCVENWGNVYTDESAMEHLADVMRNLRSIGVRVLVLYTGHYPGSQLQMVRKLATRFSRGSMRTIAFCEKDLFGTGDHAGVWETSICLALRPELVDMKRIGPKNARDHSWNETTHPNQSTAAFGRRAVRKIVTHLAEEVEKRMAEFPPPPKWDDVEPPF